MPSGWEEVMLRKILTATGVTSGEGKAARQHRTRTLHKGGSAMLRKSLAALSALLLTAGVTTFVATTASAHTGDLNATAVCQSDGQYLVTYKLTTSNTTLTGTTYWKIGNSTFAGTPTSNAGLTLGPVSSTGSQTITLGTKLLPGSSTSAPWAYAFTTWSDGYTKGSDGGDITLAGTCKPTQPTGTKGTDTSTTQICRAPADGTATVTHYAQSWTQDYVWDTNSHTWVLGSKVYGAKTVTSTSVVDDQTCRPDKPTGLHGTDPLPPSHVCVDPKDGTATDTSYAKDWTQSYSWNSDTHSWVLGAKVYGDAYVTGTKVVDDQDCIPPVPTQLKGTDPLPPVHECVDPANGTATDTYYARDWTEDSTWDIATHHYVLGAKVYGAQYVTDTKVVDDENCIPEQPTGLHGTDPLPPTHECVEPADGTATDTYYAEDWTQTYSWNNDSHTWVLGDKVYGDQYVTSVVPIDDESCIPLPPDGLRGTDPVPPTDECVSPADGTATETSYAKDWTQDYSWDGTSHTWVLGDKVFGEQYVTGVENVESQNCTPPTLQGTAFASQCVDDVPWINYDVKLVDPFNLSTDDGTATFTFTAPGSSETFVKVVPIGSGKFLWPGASATDNGDGTFTATGWPGWELDGTTWKSVGDANYGWTRNGVNVHIEVNPQMDVTLSYPPPTALCVAGPPTEIHNELDAPPAEAVEADAQFAG